MRRFQNKNSHTNIKTIVNPILKNKVTFERTSLESKGKLTVLSVKLRPNGGTPLHYFPLHQSYGSPIP
ncbi:hypothetical protein SAMN05216436_105191 [bacterium A37T11]|nr:hypothetical protein SAMN05216436_105191 [bacterium A37T11]